MLWLRGAIPLSSDDERAEAAEKMATLIALADAWDGCVLAPVKGADARDAF